MKRDGEKVGSRRRLFPLPPTSPGNDVDKRESSTARSADRSAGGDGGGKEDPKREDDEGELSPEDDTRAEDRLSPREQLQIIKATTMYKMVDELDDGARKILFLTNAQVMDTYLAYCTMLGPFLQTSLYMMRRQSCWPAVKQRWNAC